MAYRADLLISAYNDRHKYPERFNDQIVGAVAKALGGKGDADAATFNVCSLAAHLIERGEPLPEYLQSFIVRVLRRDPVFKPASKPGRKYGDLAHRDVFIQAAIKHVAEKWKFPATRRAMSRPSAASIVQEALAKGAGVHLSEKAVDKIWGSHLRYRRAVRKIKGD